MNKYKCSCGGSINPPVIIGLDVEKCLDLYMCIDCGKSYIEKQNKTLDKTLKLLSISEFRRIVSDRKQ